jgi:hypothetical protein
MLIDQCLKIIKKKFLFYFCNLNDFRIAYRKGTCPSPRSGPGPAKTGGGAPQPVPNEIM